VDKAGAVHRLDRGPNRLALSSYPSGERPERIGIGRDGGYESAAAVLAQHMDVEPLL
jgi:hypothetical protein